MRRTHYISEIPVKDIRPELKYEETSDKDSEGQHTNHWPVVRKRFKVMEVRERLKNCPRLKKT